jgi:hypothetical protein
MKNSDFINAEEKTKFTLLDCLFLVAIVALLAVAILCTGCVTEHKQVYLKSTTVGLVIQTSPQPGIGGLMPNVKLGIIRDVYLSNPTSTNSVYCAPFNEQATAKVGIFSQSGSENISTTTNNQPPLPLP